jgi:hypothetical protein
MKTYKPADMEKMKTVIETAREMWDEQAKKEFEKYGDRGSCIVGDGIVVSYIPPRCRKPTELFIIRSSSVAYCQGNLHYEATLHVALDYLKSHGIECRYNHGRMD